MHKLVQLLFCALLLGAAPAPPPSIKIVDIMPAFWRVWDGHYTEAQRVRASVHSRNANDRRKNPLAAS